MAAPTSRAATRASPTGQSHRRFRAGAPASGGQPVLGHHLDDRHRLLETLEPHRTPFDETNALESVAEPDHSVRREDLARLGRAAEPRGRVQRLASVAALDWNGLARVEPDPDREWKRRAFVSLFTKTHLERDRGPQGLAGRGEDAQRLVASQLDQLSAVRGDRLAGELGERGGQPSRLLVPSLLREARVAANVGDQEGVDRGPGCFGLSRRPLADRRPRRIALAGAPVRSCHARIVGTRGRESNRERPPRSKSSAVGRPLAGLPCEHRCVGDVSEELAFVDPPKRLGLERISRLGRDHVPCEASASAPRFTIVGMYSGSSVSTKP